MNKKQGKSRLRATKQKKAVDLVLRMLLAIGIITNIGLWGLVYDLTRIIQALPVPEVIVIEKQISAKDIKPELMREISFTPSKNTRALIDRNQDVTIAVRDEFGEFWTYAIELVGRESSLDPSAVNSSSGACGLFQAYPCQKMACSLSDIDCQVSWGASYIKSRYGNAKNALEFHSANGWY